jgi:hypothetical protein
MKNLYFHATNKIFDRFEQAPQGKNGASNGCLGVWVGNERSECEMFGDFLMTLSLDDVEPYPLQLRELKKMHDGTIDMTAEEAANYYRTFARELMDDGYNVIDIHEMKGVLHSIILDLDAIVIESCERIEKEKPSAWGR